MKIAITAKGDSLDSQVDSRFGRATKFIVFDTDKNDFCVIENLQNLNAAQGAGIQSAQSVVASGAEYVITGHCGPKAFRVLRAADVKVILECSGTVGKALDKFSAGELNLCDSPDVESHWL